MEPPSEQLVAELESLHLATRRDLAQCRAIVRRTARGVPAFDSVWIDGLVSLGTLTPFQATHLESHTAHRLRVGSTYLLTEQLHFDPALPVYRALEIGSRRSVIVTRAALADEEPDAIRRRFEKFFAEVRKFPDSEVCLPTEYIFNMDAGEVDVVFGTLAGQPLTDLMIRRGRIPEEVVRSIAAQIGNQLRKFPEGSVHGDIRLSNVWVDRQGRVQLANVGVLSCLCPQPTIHARLPRETYDTLAPERIIDRREPTKLSDVYALGCLFWQMLAGRPPHLVADPLAKLAAHQQGEIPDIRTVAPDVSEEFASKIRQMTRSDPQLRRVTSDERATTRPS